MKTYNTHQRKALLDFLQTNGEKAFTIEEIAWNTQIITDNDMLLNNVCDKESYYLISDDILNDVVLF